MRDARIVALDVTGAASVNSDPFPITQDFAMSVQAQSVVDAVGTLKVQFSNDQYQSNSQIQPTHWTDVPSASVAVTAAAVVGIAKFDVCYNWARLVYTRTSGAGGLIAVVKTNGY